MCFKPNISRVIWMLKDYGGGVKTLALCPSTPNCIATSEETNDPDHFVPPW